jgi:hypothetical protein
MFQSTTRSGFVWEWRRGLPNGELDLELKSNPLPVEKAHPEPLHAESPSSTEIVLARVSAFVKFIPIIDN